MKTLFISLLLFSCLGNVFAQTSDFIPGGNTIFEDNFSRDPIGDFPARWSTSSEGAVVELDGFPGKWLKINGNVAVNPELKKKLPEDCTIEFDLVVKKESCRVQFGITPISDVAAGNIHYKQMGVTLQNMTGYPGLVVTKDVQDLSSKRDFDMDGYIDRILHVSISINKTRFRVYLDETKVVDMPKLITPEYRNNFFVAGGTSIPTPPEGIFISNVRIAAGEADARRLLIKQLYEQGSVVTSDISFNPQTNDMTQQSLPVLDNLGQAMAQDPNLNIQINGTESMPAMAQSTVENNSAAPTESVPTEGAPAEELVKQKVEKMKAYLIQKFHVKVDRIVTGVNNKIKAKADTLQNGKTGSTVKGFLTQIVKL
jgi:OmpA-OmpF porin, OOP family